MIHPIFQDRWHIAISIAICLLGGLLQAALLYPLVAVPWCWLLLDGMVFAVLLGAISIPLWMVIRFVDVGTGSKIQKWLNSFALCVLTIGCWLGLGMLVLYIALPTEYFDLLIPTMPSRVVGGIMLYVMLVQHFIMVIEKEKAEEEEKEQDAIAEMIIAPESLESESDLIEIIDRIAVKVGQKIHVIAIPDILYLQAEGDYVMIHTADGRYLKEQTMKYFEQHLPNNKFVRVHRSCIVNVEIISRVELYEKQNYLLYLQNGQKIKASTNGYKLLKKTLSL